MPIASWGYVVVAVVCITVGLQWLTLAARMPGRRVHLLFAATAAAAAVDALLQRRFIDAVTGDEFHALFRWTAVSICAFLILLLWFTQVRTGAVRRGLLVAATVLLVVTAVLDFLLPRGINATMYVSEIRQAVLPWGEVVQRAEGEASRWRLVGDLANVTTLVCLLDTTVRLIRRDRKREAWLIGASLAAIGLSVLAIIPMDLGLIDLPALHPFAFLAIVAIMGWDLTESSVATARLSREVFANEKRYRDLIAGSSLLIVELDTEGRIVAVNPTVETVTGRAAAEHVGRSAVDLAPPDQREAIGTAVREALAGRAPVETERPLVGVDGHTRTIAWRSVTLYDVQGEVRGLLSLGADVTARHDAEAARDQATADLERSVTELRSLQERLEAENLILKEEIEVHHDFEGIVGDSDTLLYTMHKIEQVAGTEATVLIQGETGVGKELVARTIHRRSKRADRPFVAVNCASLAPSVIESELFGHEQGAFTGADRQRKGRFELADGGTLFFDEIGELPPEIQPKLLRVLEEGEFDRVGGTGPVRVDARVIVATNRRLRDEVVAGRFREDLFYRLEVYPITVPPLRARSGDVARLAAHFISRLNERRADPIVEIPSEVMRTLEAYPWPGNIRELKNVIERSALRTTGRVLQLAEPLVADGRRPASEDPGLPDAVGQRATLEEVERAHIREVVELCGGRIAGPGGAAGVLGLHPNTLRSRMKKLGIANGRSGHGPRPS